MSTRKLFHSDPSTATKLLDPAHPNLRMGDYGYGKNGVRVFQLQKDGPIHKVIEYKLNMNLRLSTHTEYYDADNSNIIGSDVMETNAYIHAQKYGLRTPEEFALSLSQYIMDTYATITKFNVIVEEMSWSRLGEHETEGLYKNKPHDHAFLQNLNGRRCCEVVRKRDDPKLVVLGGIVELHMLKTTRAPFFRNRNALDTEKTNKDRILNIDVNAKWEYKTIQGIDFKTHWQRIRDIIIYSFVGDSVKGTDITSVQLFSYKAEVDVLNAVPEICSVEVVLKNLHQAPFDFSRFPPFEPKADVVIVQPVDEPHSYIYGQTDRLDNSKL